MAKIKTLIIILLSLPVLLLAQETEKDLLATDTAWGKEIFTFPIRFAKEINYKGFEEAKFPRGWSTKESEEYWSYVFAWQIDSTEKKLTGKEIEADLETYFDGLMEMYDYGKEEFGILETTALLVKTGASDNVVRYTGKVKTFDRFFTKKPFILNVMVEKHDCDERNRTLIIFRFSPKELEHNIWRRLEQINLSSDVCED